MTRIYINLPVSDLPKSIAFYTALWFTNVSEMTDEHAGMMMYGDNLYLMLLTHDFMKKFLPASKTIADSKQTCQVLNALEMDSKEAVDALFDKAIAAWGIKTIDTYDMWWFMYGRDFEDLDGHIWEAFWMDMSKIPQAE